MMTNKMKKGDTVYYKNDPCTIIREASPFVFGYLAKKNYVMVQVSPEIAKKWQRDPKVKLVRIYAISSDKLVHKNLQR